MCFDSVFMILNDVQNILIKDQKQAYVKIVPPVLYNFILGESLVTTSLTESPGKSISGI